MAFSRNAGFTSAIATDAGATAAGYLTPARYNLPHTVTDAVSGAIPYFDSTTSEAVSALLAANAVVLGGGAGAAPLTYADFNYNDSTKRATVGTGSGTSTGLIIGYAGSSGFGGIWGTNTTPSTTKGIVFGSGDGDLYLQSNNVWFRPGGSNFKMQLTNTAGQGPLITAGTATTDVAIESLTGTWNNAACATGWKLAITDTTSAAGALPWQILGGASATTALASLTKAGKFEAVSFRANGSDGVSFGPAAVASITVVNGIITAIS